MRKSIGYAAVLVMSACVILYAVSTENWKVSSQTDFLAGTIDGLSVTSGDELLLAPHIESIKGMDGLYAWCVVRDSKGNLYVGTGDKGSIYKVTEEGKAELLYRFSQLHIHSLAVDPSDNVYAATSPGGIIYKVTPDGKTSVFHDSAEPYIWAILIDGRSSFLYAATGDQGKVLRLSLKGKPKEEVLLDSNQTNLLCLALDKTGNLYTGSDPDGLVYRITPKGEVSVVFDASEREVHCMVIGSDGTIYAGTAEALTPAGAPPVPSAPMPAAAETVKRPPTRERDGGKAPRPRAEAPLPIPVGIPKPQAKPRTNSIYAIAPDGGYRKLFALDETLVLALAMVEDRLLIGTGNDGKLYRLNTENPQEFELLRAGKERQLCSILPTEKGIFLSASNPGTLLRMNNEYSRKGSFVSAVKDCDYQSEWGNISWKGAAPSGTRVSLSVRTGNSSTPDETWSTWTGEYTKQAGEKVKSRVARFIQVRATLTTSDAGKTPVVKELCVAFLPKNARPIVSDVEVDGGVAEDKAKTKSGNRKEGKAEGQATHKTVREIKWSASDPNNDKLSFDIHYKALEEKEWKPLKLDIKDETSHKWDTMSVPDGEYQVKVVATDRPSNPPDRALTFERTSTSFVIDNTRPSVTELKYTIGKGNKCVVEGRAVDALSNIGEISYSVDAGEWVWIYPVGDLYDARDEAFRFETNSLSKGEHTIVIKALDAVLNVGCGKVVIEIP